MSSLDLASAPPRAPTLGMKDAIRAARLIARYHFEGARRACTAPFLPSLAPATGRDTEPRVTVLVTSVNQRASLELTLRTLCARAGYSNYVVWVADHASTDGSIELVDDLIAKGWPIKLIQHGARRPQHEWYDFMLRNADSPYWVGLHEDLHFFGKGWLADLVGFLDRNPSTDMVGGEYFPPTYGQAEPVNGEIVDVRESLSTWVFAVRTSLREKIDTSFEYFKERDPHSGRTVLYDQGGKLIADMRAAGLTFACMPTWFTLKFQHIGNLSWAFNHPMNPSWRALKLHQKRDAMRRARRVARRQGDRTYGAGL
jgi:hypothetical protein